MGFSVTISRKVIIPLFTLLVVFVGLIIKENQISVWGSIELSIISFFAFLISLSMLFDDAAKPAENQFDENVKIINQEDGPKAVLEATPGDVSRAVPKETELLLIPQSPVLMPSVLSPIIGCWKLEDKARAELEEKTAAAAEAKRLKNQRKNKARKEKRILEKQSTSESQSSDEDQSSGEDTPNDGNQLVVYGNILSDNELNVSFPISRLFFWTKLTFY
jgi:hypothetical protein